MQHLHKGPKTCMFPRNSFAIYAREFADAPRDPAAKPMAPKTTERIHDGDDFAFGKIEF